MKLSLPNAVAGRLDASSQKLGIRTRVLPALMIGVCGTAPVNALCRDVNASNMHLGGRACAGGGARARAGKDMGRKDSGLLTTPAGAPNLAQCLCAF